MINPTAPRLDVSLLGPNTRSAETDLQLEEFRATHCPDIEPMTMKFMIQKGDTILAELSTASVTDATWKEALTHSSKENAIYVMWAITKKTAEQGQLFISGATRIGVEPEKGKGLTGEKMEAFFKACGKGEAYSRISTHMKEGLSKADTQWGLDLGDMPTKEGKEIGLPAKKNIKIGLPAGKRTLLFAKQPDGTLYIKMEEHGCPPFWKKKFQTWKNFVEFVGHAIDFIRTRFFASTTKPKGLTSWVYKTRKEHVSKPLIKLFALRIKNQYASSPTATVQEKKINMQKAQVAIRKGSKGGISTMLEALKDEEDHEREKALWNELRRKVETARKSGYTGGIKGEEVLIPNLTVPVPNLTAPENELPPTYY